MHVGASSHQKSSPSHRHAGPPRNGGRPRASAGRGSPAPMQISRGRARPPHGSGSCSRLAQLRARRLPGDGDAVGCAARAARAGAGGHGRRSGGFRGRPPAGLPPKLPRGAARAAAGAPRLPRVRAVPSPAPGPGGRECVAGGGGGWEGCSAGPPWSGEPRPHRTPGSGETSPWVRTVSAPCPVTPSCLTKLSLQYPQFTSGLDSLGEYLPLDKVLYLRLI